MSKDEGLIRERSSGFAQKLMVVMGVGRRTKIRIN